MTEDLQELLFALCAAPGTPGDESEAARRAAWELSRLRRNRDRPHGKCHLPHRKPNRPTADSLGRPPGQVGLIVTRTKRTAFCASTAAAARTAGSSRAARSPCLARNR